MAKIPIATSQEAGSFTEKGQKVITPPLKFSDRICQWSAPDMEINICVLGLDRTDAGLNIGEDLISEWPDDWLWIADIKIFNKHPPRVTACVILH